MTPADSYLIPSWLPPLSQPPRSPFIIWATPFWSNWDTHPFPLYYGYAFLNLIAFPQHGSMETPVNLSPISQIDAIQKLIQTLVLYEDTDSSKEYLLDWATHLILNIPNQILTFPKQKNWSHFLTKN